MYRDRRRAELAEAIASSWNDARIPYAVVHGLERYPSRLGRDLDFVIRSEHVPPAGELAIDQGRAHGFDTVLFRWSYWGLYQLALIDAGSRTSLPLDFLCTTGVWRAKWVRVVDETVLDRLVRGDGLIGPFRVSHEGTFLKSCVRPLLCGDLSRFGDEWPLPVPVPPVVERERLLELVGPAGLRFLGLQSVSALDREFPAGMRSMQRAWATSHPLGALRSLMDAVTGRALRHAANAADVILIESPRPESVMRALAAMVPEARKMFIELRPALAPSSGHARAWKSLLEWRPPPVSEFVVTAAVARGASRPRPGHEEAVAVGEDARRLRNRLQPDLFLRVPAGSDEETRETLRDHLLEFLSGRYRPPSALSPIAPEVTPAC
jgi:hypothetical protein